MEDNTEDNLEQIEGQEAMTGITLSDAEFALLSPFLTAFGSKPVSAVTMLGSQNIAPEVDANGRPFFAHKTIYLSKRDKEGVYIEWRSDYPLDDMAVKLNFLFMRYASKLRRPDFFISLKDMMRIFYFDVEWDAQGRVKRDEHGNTIPIQPGTKTYKNRVDYLRDRVDYSYEALYGVDMQWNEDFGPYDNRTHKRKYNTRKRGPHWRIVDASDPRLLKNAGLYVHLSGPTYNNYLEVANQIMWYNPAMFGLSRPAFALVYRVLSEASRTYTLDTPQSFYVETLYDWTELPSYWEQIEKDKAAKAEGKTPKLHYNEEYAYPFHDVLKEILDAHIFANIAFTDPQGHPITYGDVNPRAYPQKNEKHDAPLKPEDTKKLLGHKKLFTGTASPNALKLRFTIKDAPHIAMPERLQELADKKTDSKAKDDGKAAKQPDDSIPET